MNTQTQTSSKTLLYLGLLILVLLGIALIALAFAQLQEQGQQLSLPGFEVGVESAQQEVGSPGGEPGPCPEFDYSRFTEQQWRYAFGSAHKSAGLRYATARLFQDFALAAGLEYYGGTDPEKTLEFVRAVYNIVKRCP
jgi:hypothetical protein